MEEEVVEKLNDIVSFHQHSSADVSTWKGEQKDKCTDHER